LVDRELKFIFTKMDILSYLASLIQTNNEVGVPGLGTFVKKKSPGRYDASLHAFLPPSYQLAFHPEVTEAGLLAEYVSKKHNLSEASANYHIEQFVTKIKQNLSDELEADVSPLGRLLLSGRLITFLPNEELNLGHQFFGLPAVVKEQTTQVEDTATEEEVIPAVPAFTPIEEYVEPVELEEKASEEEVLSADEPVVVEETTAEDMEKLEAIVMENNIEEENPGQLPEEPIYVAEPAELAEEPALEETTSVVDEKPVEELPNIEAPPFVETPPVVESPVVIPPAFVEETPAAIKTPEAVVPLVTGAAIIPEEAVNYQIEEQPRPTTPGYYKIVIGVLFILCLAFGLYMLNPDWFRKTDKTTPEPEPTTVPLEDKATVILPDTLEKQTDTLQRDAAMVDTTTAIVLPAAKKPVVEKPVTLAPAKPAVISYEVIASSVYGEKAAQQFISSMKRKWGINAKIVSKLPGKKIKISVGSYKDEKTARLERARLEEKLNIPGLYIYTNTNKPD
jgi:nucleoid DNA-binding protein